MATSLDPETAKRMERRERVLVGDLSPDFLRIHGGRGIASSELATGKPLTSQQIQEQMDEQAALALHHQLNAAAQIPQAAQQVQSNIRGRLLISVMQAKLVKNYGMTRMDPYVSINGCFLYLILSE